MKDLIFYNKLDYDYYKLKEQILEVLKTDDRVWAVGADDKKELNQTSLLSLVEKIDENIIQLLLEDDNIRDKFFVKIKDVYVFKTNDFVFFMEENKVNNMYTQYKNQIGLTDGKRFIDDSKDVVLNWLLRIVYWRAVKAQKKAWIITFNGKKQP